MQFVLWDSKFVNNSNPSIKSIDDSLNQYRLGSIFLRNFYVGLDFEHNKILIGLNKNTEDA